MKDLIIKSLLDNDFYKFTMGNVVYKKFPTATARYEFICRSKDVDFSHIRKDIVEQIVGLDGLKFEAQELDFLRSIKFLDPSYVRFLKDFRFDSNNVQSSIDDAGMLHLSIQGAWLHTIFYEVPLLAIINELYFQNSLKQEHFKSDEFLTPKIALLKANPGVRFSDFGTRRRYSRVNQFNVVSRLHREVGSQLNGTSNVKVAQVLGVTPIGTQAHEYFMAHQALYRVQDHQKKALMNWAEAFDGNLGIALTDTLGLEAFLKDFTLMPSKLFDGVRHDSGDPYFWGNRMIEHYTKLGINPMSKTLVFSDNLDVPKAVALYNEFHGKAKVSFGIGTNLTNDVGVKPISIVIKMTHCNGQAVAKISDAPAKAICSDPVYFEYLKQCFGVKGFI